MGCLQYARLEELDDEEVLSIPIGWAPWNLGISNHHNPRCSMVLEYLPTFTTPKHILKNGLNVGKYSRHGASGIFL